ncbi:SMI1/KNR4 family protein [Nostoc sp.]|uniref:SMI1/KNR4 family protein n=1 Tax=Nostoc sp. TaxID=1180 RepID=UPI002FF730B5
MNWRRVNYPDADSALSPGLTDPEIATLTQDIPFELPLEVCELFQCCHGDHVQLDPSLVLHSLKSALEQSLYSNWMKGDKWASSDYALPIFHGYGKDFYYVLCDKEQKDKAPVWCVFAGEEPRMYAASLTSLILTISECYERGAYYVYFYEESGDFGLEEDFEKSEKIFQKYNPEQMDTWGYLHKD